MRFHPAASAAEFKGWWDVRDSQGDLVKNADRLIFVVQDDERAAVQVKRGDDNVLQTGTRLLNGFLSANFGGRILTFFLQIRDDDKLVVTFRVLGGGGPMPDEGGTSDPGPVGP